MRLLWGQTRCSNSYRTRPVWSMSCPCQPFSSAGKGLGTADERHLWPVAFNLIKECRPPVVFGEQVASSAVVGKQSEMDAMPQMRRKQAILRFLSGKESETTIILQGLQEQANQSQEERKLFSRQNHQKGAYPGWSCEVSRSKDGDTIRSGCGGNSLQNRDGSVRVDRDTIRSSDTESMEQPVTGSNQAFSGIHQGQCEDSSILCKCDESQLGAEVCLESCGCNAQTAQEEVQRLIGEIGGESEEAAIIWVDGVQDDLEKIDYTFGSCVMAASSVGSPHIRQRLYWVANAPSGQCKKLGQARYVSGEREVHIQPASCSGADGWSRYDLIPCRDGKRRRIESGTFPLVNGLPKGMVYSSDPSAPINPQETAEARVMRLKGYGNAIVPQVAAQFITAAQATLPTL